MVHHCVDLCKFISEQRTPEAKFFVLRDKFILWYQVTIISKKILYAKIPFIIFGKFLCNQHSKTETVLTMKKKICCNLPNFLFLNISLGAVFVPCSCVTLGNCVTFLKIECIRTARFWSLTRAIAKQKYRKWVKVMNYLKIFNFSAQLWHFCEHWLVNGM